VSPAQSKIYRFVAELCRRKVIRLLGAYIAIFWLLATGLSDILPALEFLPEWSFQAFVVVGVAIIPVVVFLSWKYDLVPPQLVRDPGDVERLNPSLAWALRRHDGAQAGYLMLRWEDENRTANEKLFYKPLAIGREPTSDIQLPDNRVSRHHAVLWAENGSWHVRDVGSSNGTYLDEVRIAGPTPLLSTCELRFHSRGPKVSVRVVKSDETIQS